MKLHRTLATAAATAVLAPAALLSATFAHANEGSARSTATPTAVETSPTTDSTAPSDEKWPTPCEAGDDFQVDEDLVTSLTGLPSKIVAGSGGHDFQLNVTNSGDNAYKRVDLGVFALQADEEFNVGTDHLELRLKGPATGVWDTISLDEDDAGAGYVGYTDVRPRESFSLDMRLSVDASAPAGLGFAISVGIYADDKGECVHSGGDIYRFDILEAGEEPGEVPDSKPQGGGRPIEPKPAGDKEIDPRGTLAETGSSAALPVIATIGGVAMAVGAGTVFVVRRRRTGAQAA